MLLQLATFVMYCTLNGCCRVSQSQSQLVTRLADSLVKIRCCRMAQCRLSLSWATRPIAFAHQTSSTYNNKNNNKTTRTKLIHVFFSSSFTHTRITKDSLRTCPSSSSPLLYNTKSLYYIFILSEEKEEEEAEFVDPYA